MLKYLKTLLNEIGLKGLYLGIETKLFQSVIYNAFQMVSYEKIQRFVKLMLLYYLRRRKMIRE